MFCLFWLLKVSPSIVMAGRKRKTLALADMAAPVKAVYKHKIRTDLKASPAKLKRAIGCESGQSAEPERSHYFAKNDPQNSLGEEFFNQSCISLAKALLGKVRLSSHMNLTSIYIVRAISKSHLMFSGGYLASKSPKGFSSFPIEFFRITINF